MRFGKALLFFLLTALFLLMLSALVVTAVPEGEATQEAIPVSQLHAQLMLPVHPVQDVAAATTRPQPLKIAASALLLTAALMLPICLKRDANGRVIVAKRYENSFYQLFRQEVAGG